MVSKLGWRSGRKEQRNSGGFVALVLLLLLVGCKVNQSEEEGASIEPNPTETPAPTPTKTIETLVPVQGDPAQDVDRDADADVLHVKAVQSADNTWTFHVTVSHPDVGWDDYADGWDVVTEQGEILKRSSSDTFTRLLLHPHETEQPFTRNQGGLVVPEGVTRLSVRAHDIVDGFGGKEAAVDLSVSSGLNFEVERP
ncbi:MAG TPA: hypothetical protein VFI27_18050 [candidate division Zixibacteria bacterium]|nr:hypothetical protein [candidate division Zixibacteria bacterium]